MRDPGNRQQRERDGQITGHTTGHDRDGRARAYGASWLRTRPMAGRVWIGTSQGHLWGYDGSRWLSVEVSDGTDGNAVNCILEDEDDTLCLGVTSRVWSTSTASASLR